MMVFRIASTLTALLAAGSLAVPAAGQPSAPDPEMPGEMLPPLGPPELLDEGSGEAMDEAPDRSLAARPGSPAEEAAERAARLDALFAKLADETTKDWQRVQDEIWRMWSRSGSASMDLLLRRADEAMKDGEPELALRFLDDLVRLDPDFAEGWNKRATAYFMLGEYGRSVADIERTLALEPRHFGALIGLAMILERLGDDRKAYRAYEEVLSVHPNLPGAAEALKRLAPAVEGREL